MSLIPSNITDALKKDAEQSARPRRESGEYLATVTNVGLADKPKPWINKGIVVDFEFADETGGDHKLIIELDPCTNREGEISPGKIKFLRWQLGALGLDAEELAFQLFGIMGKTYKVRYTVDDGLNEDGTPKNPNANLNPHTGKPYVNRDLVVLEAVEAPQDAAQAAENADPEGPEEGA